MGRKIKKAYLIKEDDEISKILNETYDEFYQAVKHRNPDAESVVDDEEIARAHVLMALMRMGYIKLSTMECRDGQYYVLEIDEKRGED